MTAQSIPSAAKAAADAAAEPVSAEVAHGAELVAPLNRLKASPSNARRTPHPAASIEALAASIKAKGVFQPPVVEAERLDNGTPTGNWLVIIGEGRRQALRLLARRKAVQRTHPVRVMVDADNDPIVRKAESRHISTLAREGSLKARTVNDLCAIARAGGGLVLHADVRPTEDLIRIAKAMTPGSHLTLQAMAFRPTEDLCRIAAAAPGQVTFIG